ncbi:MAG: ergothioneine biosynthesis protein EgtB, partial [Cyanobium sp.]
FMTSQFVLRGSCLFTPSGHGRDTYRNFFPPASRWMAAGVRLARASTAPAAALAATPGDHI